MIFIHKPSPCIAFLTVVINLTFWSIEVIIPLHLSDAFRFTKHFQPFIYLFLKSVLWGIYSCHIFCSETDMK